MRGTHFFTRTDRTAHEPTEYVQNGARRDRSRAKHVGGRQHKKHKRSVQTARGRGRGGRAQRAVIMRNASRSASACAVSARTRATSAEYARSAHALTASSSKLSLNSGRQVLQYHFPCSGGG